MKPKWEKLDVQAFEREFESCLNWHEEWEYHSKRHEELRGYPKAEAEVHEEWLRQNDVLYLYNRGVYDLFKTVGLI